MCARAADQKRLLEKLKAQGFMGTARLALRKLRVAHKLESNSIDDDEVYEVTDKQAADADDVLDLAGGCCLCLSTCVHSPLHACLMHAMQMCARHTHAHARTRKDADSLWQHVQASTWTKIRKASSQRTTMRLPMNRKHPMREGRALSVCVGGIRRHSRTKRCACAS
jgi:hypothetical protein